MFISSQAVYSLVLFRGLNLISEGRFAVYVKGPDKVSKSWVPIATKVLFLNVEGGGEKKAKKFWIFQSRNSTANRPYVRGEKKDFWHFPKIACYCKATLEEYNEQILTALKVMRNSKATQNTLF